jgi:hypothetical protein
MKNTAFAEFVQSQQEPEQPEVNWNNVRDEWLKHLDELYMQIKGFLKEYIESRPPKMRFESSDIELYEENIGTYTAKKFTLKIGRKQVKFVPAGTCLSGGAKGRVDVIGPYGTEARLLLVSSKATNPRDVLRVFLSPQGKQSFASGKQHREKLEWKIVTRPPERRFIEITEQSIHDMIMEVANG